MIISKIKNFRERYHNRISKELLAKRGDTVNVADVSSGSSKRIANELAELLGGAQCDPPPSVQRTGRLFTEITLEFLREAFSLLREVRPGDWGFQIETPISKFEQYEHLLFLETLAREKRDIAISLGIDYLVRPDIVIYRQPIADEKLVDTEDEQELKDADEIAKYTPLRKKNTSIPILHASISCKWTIRSDRAQNIRTEALNLIRNRKGHTPHIIAVTAEPLPTRIASLALGTGDLDCVYHMALPELEKAVQRSENEDQWEMLRNLIDGRRLRDISDLVFDLAI